MENNNYRILAVIPARAGSKGVPNKNIRIVAGHPLIYYSINNALRSKFITDIVVTTDSPEVSIIAKQMGVNVKWRSKELCEDAVTLDAVIFDAIPSDVRYDYIITMQPTSPTLNVNTLDSAINYAIENELDTLISAINAPHLSWRVEGDRKVPNYIERLNRQYLPPCYMETGAFVVSKASVVTKNSRIGTKVDVFELPEDEAQDIDTFSDLKVAASLLEREKVAIYVNGSNRIGMGHVYRALELADEFYSKPDIIFDTNETSVSVFGNTKHNLIPVNGVEELIDRCRNERYTIFINDVLDTSYEYMSSLKDSMPDCKIINFEDSGDGTKLADIVFNALYSHSEQANVHAGEKYYIAPKTFMFYKPICIDDRVKNVFISFGGADPQNYSDRLLQIVSKDEYKEFKFIVVLGRAKKNVNELLKYNENENIEVLYDVANMPELMTSCDIGITSRGRTGYELALLGIPTIAMAQNYREEKHGFISNENGFTYIGLNPENEIIESNLKMYLESSKIAREKFQDKLLSHDLRGGRKRVMGLINSI